MNESIQVEPFEAKFEDVVINFHKLNLTFLTEIKTELAPRNTGGSEVFHNVQIHHCDPKGKDCVGDIIVMFRNQGKEFSSCLQLACTIIASSASETSGKSLFCKVMQYLFDWTKKYVDEKSIKDMSGEPFILPAFFYAKDQFTSIEN